MLILLLFTLTLERAFALDTPTDRIQAALETLLRTRLTPEALEREKRFLRATPSRAPGA
jgi:hypothetical protein